MKVFNLITIMWMGLLTPLLAQTPMEEIFTSIYYNRTWGTNHEGLPSSGGGATFSNTESYRQFLENFFRENNVHSVVDVGCSDWEYGATMNWDGIEYHGYDVVKPWIIQNKIRFNNRPNIHFHHADVLTIDLPSADVLLCKDVLQHWNNKDIFSFLMQLHKYKYCIITNDVDLSPENANIQCGEYRPVDLTLPPFCLWGTKVLEYPVSINMKQILVLKRMAD